jgi:hypothetical protein
MAYENEELLTAAMGGFPLGDLNWFPEEKEAWEAQRDAEWDRIREWMSTGSDPLGTSIAEEKPETPSGFKLEQNYPNPFNPSTNIKFALTERKDVRVEVYDRIGRKISTLIDDELSRGFHTVQFDGSGFASGVYFYRIVTDQAAITRKMVLVK